MSIEPWVTPVVSAEEKAAEIVRLAQRRAEVERRLTSLDSANEDVVTDEIARCMICVSNDPTRGFWYWCDHYAFTFDPRKIEEPHQRFVLYTYQVHVAHALLTSITQGGVVHMEKSRDMGASWLVMALFTWLALFKESFQALVGSRVEDLVDNYTVDSLFGKIDYLLEKLPPWMIPHYAPKTDRRLLRIGIGDSLITGESANRSFGRGPRKNVVYLDEFAFWDHDSNVWASVSQTSPCRIVTSTPFGDNNVFARMRSLEGIHRIRLHWKLHPTKDETWYQNQCKELTEQEIAQELDIDYQASAGGVALPRLHDNESRIVMSTPALAHTLGTPSSKYYAGLDWGFGNRNATALNVYMVTRLQSLPVPLVTCVWETYGTMDAVEFKRRYLQCPYLSMLEAVYCDPSMFYYNQSGDNGVTSVAYILRDKYGITTLRPGKRGDAAAIETLNSMIVDHRFHIYDCCPELLRELKGLRYETSSSRMANKRNEPERLVDKDNHCYDALKYLLNSIIPLPEISLEQSTKKGYDRLQESFNELRRTKLTPPPRVSRLARMFN